MFGIIKKLIISIFIEFDSQELSNEPNTPAISFHISIMLLLRKYYKVHHIETKISHSIPNAFFFILKANEKGENFPSVTENYLLKHYLMASHQDSKHDGRDHKRSRVLPFPLKLMTYLTSQ